MPWSSLALLVAIGLVTPSHGADLQAADQASPLSETLLGASQIVSTRQADQTRTPETLLGVSQITSEDDVAVQCQIGGKAWLQLVSHDPACRAFLDRLNQAEAAGTAGSTGATTGAATTAGTAAAGAGAVGAVGSGLAVLGAAASAAVALGGGGGSSGDGNVPPAPPPAMPPAPPPAPPPAMPPAPPPPAMPPAPPPPAPPPAPPPPAMPPAPPPPAPPPVVPPAPPPAGPFRYDDVDLTTSAAGGCENPDRIHVPAPVFARSAPLPETGLPNSYQALRGSLPVNPLCETGAHTVHGLPTAGANPGDPTVNYKGANVRVAVIDTGVDAGHSAFAGALVGGGVFPSGSTVVDGDHGTHVAGIIAGRPSPQGNGNVLKSSWLMGSVDNPNIAYHGGMAPEARIIPITLALNRNATDILAAFSRASADGATIINNSWGAAPLRRQIAAGRFIVHPPVQEARHQILADLDTAYEDAVRGLRAGGGSDYDRLIYAQRALLSGLHENTVGDPGVGGPEPIQRIVAPANPAIIVWAAGNHGFNDVSGRVNEFNAAAGGVRASPSPLYRDVVLDLNNALPADRRVAANTPAVETILPVVSAGLRPFFINVVALQTTARGAAQTLAPYSNGCGASRAWCLAAPGTTITGPTTSGARDYVEKQGTSMAAPVVSGAAAMLKGRWDQLTAQEIVKILLTTAERRDSSGERAAYGFPAALPRPAAGAASAATRCPAFQADGSIDYTDVPDDAYGCGLLDVEKAFEPPANTVLAAGIGIGQVFSAPLAPRAIKSAAVHGVRAASSKIAPSRAFGTTLITQPLSFAGIDAFNRDFFYKLPIATTVVPRPTAAQFLTNHTPRTENLTPIAGGLSFGLVSGNNVGHQLIYVIPGMRTSFTRLERAAVNPLSNFDQNNKRSVWGLVTSSATALATSHTTFALAPDLWFETSFEQGALGQKADTDLFYDYSVGITHTGKRTTTGLMMGSFVERNSFLGSHGYGGYELGGHTVSHYLQLDMGHRLGDHLMLDAGYTMMNSHIDFRHNRFTKDTRVRSDALNITAVASDIFFEHDTLSLGFRQPLAVRKGTLSQTSLKRTSAGLVVSLDEVNLGIRQREQTLTLGYKRAYNKHVNLFAEAATSRNWSNQPGLNNTFIITGLALTF
ncbi:MAG: S8 family peptidase [Pseudomonadota bacterium]